MALVRYLRPSLATPPLPATMKLGAKVAVIEREPETPCAPENVKTKTTEENNYFFLSDIGHVYDKYIVMLGIK